MLKCTALLGTKRPEHSPKTQFSEAALDKDKENAEKRMFSLHFLSEDDTMEIAVCRKEVCLCGEKY
jgi:hypothetical protein